MKHIGTKNIETSRLLLRRFQSDDVDDMFENWANDEAVTYFLTWPPHKNKEVTRQIIQDWIQQYEKLDNYNWAIVLKDNQKVIGSIAVTEQNEKAQLAQIGYCLSRTYWHQGIMSEALNAVIDFLFNQVEFECIQARHAANNLHSGGVMKKCGMTYEGTLRHSDWNNQGVCDICNYSILRSEYIKKEVL